MIIESYSQPIMIEIGRRLSFINVSITSGKDPKGVVLCLHDMMSRGTEFQPMADTLAARGWKVVAPDFPGRGQSVWIPPELYTLHTYVDVVAAVLRNNPHENFVLFGVGWGAMLALAVENLWLPKPVRLVLCDLPITWSFGTDRRAQLWSQLAAIVAPTNADFMVQAAEIADPFGAIGPGILAAAQKRLSGPEEPRSLSVDPAAFDIIRHNRDVVFSTVPMLRVCRTALSLIFSKSAAQDNLSAILEEVSPRVSATIFLSLCQSFLDWTDPTIFIPAVKAVKFP